jgi:predicted transcriptional regulator
MMMMMTLPDTATPVGLWSELELLEAEVEDVDLVDGPTGPDWVEAAPFRAHVRQLITDCGLTWRIVAVLAEVPSAALRHLLHGRQGHVVTRVHPMVAERLFSLTAANIADAARRLRPASETCTLLQRLLQRGWTAEELSRRCGLPADELINIAGGRQAGCSQLTAAVVKAAAQALWATPAPSLARPHQVRTTA